MQEKITGGRCTDNLSGRHTNQTTNAPTFIIPHPFSFCLPCLPQPSQLILAWDRYWIMLACKPCWGIQDVKKDQYNKNDATAWPNHMPKPPNFYCELWPWLSSMAAWGYSCIIIIKGIYIAQVRKGHKCAISAEMAVWLCNCLCLYSYLHN